SPRRDSHHWAAASRMPKAACSRTSPSTSCRTLQRKGTFGTFSGLGRGHRRPRSEEHTSELQSRENLVCRLLLEKKKIRISIALCKIRKICWSKQYSFILSIKTTPTYGKSSEDLFKKFEGIIL